MASPTLVKLGLVSLVIVLVISLYVWIHSLEFSNPIVYLFMSYFDILGLTVLLAVTAIIIFCLMRKFF